MQGNSPTGTDGACFMPRPILSIPTADIIRKISCVWSRDPNSRTLPNKSISVSSGSDRSDSKVVIALYLKDDLLGPDWTKVIEVEDTGSSGAPLLKEGYAGIRTDFMDIRFKNYEAIENPAIAKPVHSSNHT